MTAVTAEESISLKKAIRSRGAKRLDKRLQADDEELFDMIDEEIQEEAR